MNRRNAIKGVVAFSFIGIISGSLYEWFTLNSKIDINLLQKKKQLIADLAEVIIPRTNTPGAKDVKVEEFILKTIINCTEVRGQNIFVNGLSDVEDYSKKQFGKSFHNCNLTEQTRILSHFEAKSHGFNSTISKIEGKFIGKPFFTQLKELTVVGYFTSQPGATDALAYDYIPGRYDGCIKLTPNQKSWATK